MISPVPVLTLIQGDALESLRSMPDESVQCCVTSPPYWGLRDYGVAGQIGLERTVGEFLDKLVDVFVEVRRVLKNDGTCWVNMGDCYVGAGLSGGTVAAQSGTLVFRGAIGKGRIKSDGLKPKDLVGQPWRLAFALQDSGWWLRSDIIWSKPNPMPESVADRPTKSHEYIFLLTKSERYYYDAEAILEPVTGGTHSRVSQNVAAQVGSTRAHAGVGKTNGNMKAVIRGGINPKAAANAFGSKQNASFSEAVCLPVLNRNKRTVWTVPTAACKDAHFATFPPDLIKPCILAGTRPGDVVLDPFSGSGTSGMVALELGRKAHLIELNPEYCALARQRCTTTIGLPL